MANSEPESLMTSTSSVPDDVIDASKLCFVIAPIGDEGSPERIHSDLVLKKIIKPATNKCGYEAKRADDFSVPGQITRDIIEKIYNAPLVIASLTGNNANVFYELALRHTLEKPSILIAPKGHKSPFDIGDSRLIYFNLDDSNNVAKCCKEIISQIKEIEKNEDDYYNPISLSIGAIIALENAQFSLKDVRIALESVTDLRQEDIVQQFREVHYRLRSYGILTKRELKELISDSQILNTLRKLYVEELFRDPSHPIDPIAIAEWGSYLYTSTHGSHSADAIVSLTNLIRRQPEYVTKHGDLVIHQATYGVNESIIDVTSIVRGAIRNNQLRILVANDTFKDDPAQYRHKQLRVNYTYKGISYPEKVIAEDDFMEIP